MAADGRSSHCIIKEGGDGVQSLMLFLPRFFFALCLFGKSTNRLPVIIWDTDVCFLITDTIHV